MFPLPFVQSSPIFCVCYDGWCYHSNNYFTQWSQTTVLVSSVGLLLQLQLQRQQRRQSATRQTAAMKIITTITMTTTKMTITNNDNANNNFLIAQSAKYLFKGYIYFNSYHHGSKSTFTGAGFCVFVSWSAVHERGCPMMTSSVWKTEASIRKIEAGSLRFPPNSLRFPKACTLQYNQYVW